MMERRRFSDLQLSNVIAQARTIEKRSREIRKLAEVLQFGEARLDDLLSNFSPSFSADYNMDPDSPSLPAGRCDLHPCILGRGHHGPCTD